MEIPYEIAKIICEMDYICHGEGIGPDRSELMLWIHQKYPKLIIVSIATEYFCRDCRQLRLNCANSTRCKNCGSDNILHGIVGSLNKIDLIIKENKKNEKETQ